MTSFEATMIAEGMQEAGPRKYKQAWQYLVDTGLAWTLQGSFGRAAAEMLRMGYLRPVRRCKFCGAIKQNGRCPVDKIDCGRRKK